MSTTQDADTLVTTVKTLAETQVTHNQTLLVLSQTLTLLRTRQRRLSRNLNLTLLLSLLLTLLLLSHLWFLTSPPPVDETEERTGIVDMVTVKATTTLGMMTTPTGGRIDE